MVGAWPVATGGVDTTTTIDGRGTDPDDARRLGVLSTASFLVASLRSRSRESSLDFSSAFSLTAASVFARSFVIRSDDRMLSNAAVIPLAAVTMAPNKIA